MVFLCVALVLYCNLCVVYLKFVNLLEDNLRRPLPVLAASWNLEDTGSILLFLNLCECLNCNRNYVKLGC